MVLQLKEDLGHIGVKEGVGDASDFILLNPLTNG